MIENGDFEVDTNNDGMADYWQFSGDSGVKANWARDKGFVGKFSQKLTCTSFVNLSPSSHAMLAQINTIKLEKGKWYKISFVAKQENIRSRTINIAISNMKAWSNCGLQESFRASQDWKRFEFVFQATQTISENVRLQFWYSTTGTFWLDSVSIVPSEPVRRMFTEVLPITDSVNLLPNSSFECGTSGWGSIADLPGWGGNLNQIVGEAVSTISQFHQSSFKINLTPDNIPIHYFDYYPLYRIPVKSPLLANLGWIMVEPGVDYTLSAYMKSADDLVGVLSVNQAFRRVLKKEVKLNSEWGRYSFTFKPETDQIFAALGMDLEKSGQESGTVWIDGVQLEKGSEATAYQQREKLEIGIESGALGNLFTYGTEPEMTAIIFNADDKASSVKLRIKTTDFYDNIIHESTQSAYVTPGQSLKVPISTGASKKGFYRLNVEYSTDSEFKPVYVYPIRFAIIEPYTKSDSLFGMNHAYPWEHLLDLSKQFGLCCFRDWSLKWHDVEGEKGTFDFTEPDHQIKRVMERGLNVLPLLPFPSSNWSSSAGPEVGASDRYPASRERVAYMPRDMEEFANYVRTTVKYYRDRLHVWEIMNEPIYTDYALPRSKGYSAEDYAKLLKVAYRAVKEADPDAFVIGGIAGGPNTYTKEFIEAGGLNWLDALNLHIYPGLTPPEAYDEPMRELRAKMRANGADKPIWFTEGAYYADDDIPFEPYQSWLKILDSEMEAAEYQIKFNTVFMAYGTEKFIYHSGTPGDINNDSPAGIFFEWGGAPRKMLATQAAMSNILTPPVKSLGQLKTPDSIMAYEFETDGRTVIVAWMDEGAKPLKINMKGKNWQVFDLQGNRQEADNIIVTKWPVYFVMEGTRIVGMPWE